MYKTIKNLFTLLALVICFNNTARSQVTFTSWVHYPYISLYAAATGAGVSTSSGITVDDQYSSLLPIGFSFNYFGNAYQKLVIGANGNICFDSSLAGGYNPWPITATLLGNSSMYNCISGPWCDMDVVYGGDISYFVTGTAPNRIFGANYCHNGMYSSATCPGQSTTTQILLYETTNAIESHIARKTVCTGWNGGKAIVGVENINGTHATVAPGRDWDSTWSATDEAWRFTPDTGDSTYSVASITYSAIPYYTIYWYDSSTGAYLGSGDSIVLSPTAVTTYIAYAIGCSDSLTSGYDTPSTGHITLMPLTNGVGSVPLLHGFNIYPNPVQNDLFIVSDEKILNVSITNLIGQTVFTTTSINTNQLQVNTADLPKGIYFIRINDAIIKKFIKE